MLKEKKLSYFEKCHGSGFVNWFENVFLNQSPFIWKFLEERRKKLILPREKRPEFYLSILKWLMTVLPVVALPLKYCWARILLSLLWRRWRHSWSALENVWQLSELPIEFDLGNEDSLRGLNERFICCCSKRLPACWDDDDEDDEDEEEACWTILWLKGKIPACCTLVSCCCCGLAVVDAVWLLCCCCCNFFLI